PFAENRYDVVVSVDTRAYQRIGQGVERRRFELDAIERAERRIARKAVSAGRAELDLATNVDGLLSRRRVHPRRPSRRRAGRTARRRRVKRRPLRDTSSRRRNRWCARTARWDRFPACRRRRKANAAPRGQRRAARPWAARETARPGCYLTSGLPGGRSRDGRGATARAELGVGGELDPATA